MIPEKKYPLLSGIPATGKTTFGAWLEQQRGFLHLDVEEDGLEKANVRIEWDELCKCLCADRLMLSLNKVNRPLVLDWGFPVSALPIVRKLKAAGFETWWFDGDIKRARERFVGR